MQVGVWSEMKKILRHSHRECSLGFPTWHPACAFGLSPNPAIRQLARSRSVE